MRGKGRPEKWKPAMQLELAKMQIELKIVLVKETKDVVRERKMSDMESSLVCWRGRLLNLEMPQRLGMNQRQRMLAVRLSH